MSERNPRVAGKELANRLKARLDISPVKSVNDQIIEAHGVGSDAYEERRTFKKMMIINCGALLIIIGPKLLAQLLSKISENCAPG